MPYYPTSRRTLPCSGCYGAGTVIFGSYPPFEQEQCRECGGLGRTWTYDELMAWLRTGMEPERERDERVADVEPVEDYPFDCGVM